MTDTKLEGAMKGLINSFHKYSTKTEGWDELSLQELTQMIKKEYPTFLSTCALGNPDGFIKGLFDNNKGQNGQVDFKGFMTIMGQITNIYHKRSHNDKTCDDRK
ncbi:protein S100-A7-like [Petaurus breviceps papuanus]|uniref:protein S100-A7-like n=1 Tax=Petaurus breviceps papuanus TaxID=3040969 RepID=UPI0036DE42F0